MNKTIQIGTRSSQLALIQANWVQALFAETFARCVWEVVPMSSPCDRDKKSDLIGAPDDFFTRDLDDALRDGRIDCAVHSAKDLPDDMPDDIDWFWLPSGADPQDVLVGSLTPKVVGVSSERRIAYAKQRFSDADLRPLRGNIEERLAKLDAGEFDCILMAAAALQRLNLEDRIAERIPLFDLPVPEGQGRLAITFRATDERFLRLRSLFVRPVNLVSAGAGAGLCTQAGIDAIRCADICLYDALVDPGLLNKLSSSAQKVYVGKLYGQHSHTQPEICAMFSQYAKQGLRVVRLKGGDAGLFGRLAEEVEMLDAQGLPYRVVPGVSSLFSATTATGLMLTRRSVTDSVRIISGHAADTGAADAQTEVIFMGTRKIDELAKRRIADGMPPSTPATVIFSASLPSEEMVFGTLGDIAGKIADKLGPPGLILIGPAAHEQFRYRFHGALRGKRVWLTCSHEVQSRAAQAVRDFGGVPIQQPLIELVPKGFPTIGKYDWIVLTSPSTVRCLMPQIDDLRSLPKLLCCGQGTANSLKKFQLTPDAMPEGDFNTEGILETARQIIPRDAQILRLRSDRAGPALAEKLREDFQCVEDFMLCENRMVECDAPDCDAVFFASVSAIQSYQKQFGRSSLNGKTVVTIGPKDSAFLVQEGLKDMPITPARSTVEDAVEALSISMIQQEVFS